jgi:hypothetical protein
MQQIVGGAAEESVGCADRAKDCRHGACNGVSCSSAADRSVWWIGACRRAVDCVACREPTKAQFLVGSCQRRIRERERELPRAEKPCDGPPCLAANPDHRDRGRFHSDWSNRHWRLLRAACLGDVCLGSTPYPSTMKRGIRPHRARNCHGKPHKGGRRTSFV